MAHSLFLTLFGRIQDFISQLKASVTMHSKCKKLKIIISLIFSSLILEGFTHFVPTSRINYVTVSSVPNYITPLDGPLIFLAWEGLGNFQENTPSQQKLLKTIVQGEP